MIPKVLHTERRWGGFSNDYKISIALPHTFTQRCEAPSKWNDICIEETSPFPIWHVARDNLPFFLQFIDKSNAHSDTTLQDSIYAWSFNLSSQIEYVRRVHDILWLKRHCFLSASHVCAQDCLLVRHRTELACPKEQPMSLCLSAFPSQWVYVIVYDLRFIATI